MTKRSDFQLPVRTSIDADARVIAWDPTDANGEPFVVPVSVVGAATLSVTGTYARTRPLNGGASIRPLIVNPLNTATLWAVSDTTFGLWDGTTYTSRVTSPNTALACFEMTQTATHLFALMGSGASQSGQLWRSTAPAADGTGVSWAKVYDMATDGGGVNAYYRSTCLAVSGANVWLLEYGGTVTGGPSLWRSTANGDSGSFTKQFTWTTGKHGHSVIIADGVPLVVIGDSGFVQTGTWMGNAAGTAFTRKHQPFPYAIRIIDTVIDGQRCLVGENDTTMGAGPLLTIESLGAAAIPTTYRPWMVTNTTPTIRGTMRQLTELPSQAGWIYLLTGEGGSVGPLDAIVQTDRRFGRPVVLETFASSGGIFENEVLTEGVVESSGAVWLGTYRVIPETYTAGLSNVTLGGGYVVPDAEVGGDLTGSVSNALIGAGRVDATRIADGAVTLAKLASTLNAALLRFGTLSGLGNNVDTSGGGDRLALGTATALPTAVASGVIAWANGVAGTSAGDMLIVPRTSNPSGVRLYGTASSNAVEALATGASGASPTIGFLGATRIVRPAVTGSRGGNAALASLITALASLGLVTDSSSA